MKTIMVPYKNGGAALFHFVPGRYRAPQNFRLSISKTHVTVRAQFTDGHGKTSAMRRFRLSELAALFAQLSGEFEMSIGLSGSAKLEAAE